MSERLIDRSLPQNIPEMDRVAEELLGFLISIRDECQNAKLSKVIDNGLKQVCPAEYAALDAACEPLRTRGKQ